MVALALGALSVVAVNIVGVVNGKAEMPTHVWVSAALIAWAGSVVFGAFGLFMGYLLPSENVMQVLGPVLAGLAGTRRPVVPDRRALDAGAHLRADADLRRWPSSRGGRCTAVPRTSPGSSTWWSGSRSSSPEPPGG